MKNIYTTLFTLFMLLIPFTGVASDNLRSISPVVVNATDLIGKVYGVVNPNATALECRQSVSERFDVVPMVEEDTEWVSSENGFSLVYEGIAPEVEAMARYDRGTVAGYGYIFYFPYEAAGRATANDSQCVFCSALLQELADNGMNLGADPNTDALFEVNGMWAEGDFQVKLREEIERETVSSELMVGEIPADREGRFVLMISVVPAAMSFTADASL